jgi:hypothetical protein
MPATLVQDLLVASLFRNFLLAERIMRAANCNPVRCVLRELRLAALLM